MLCPGGCRFPTLPGDSLKVSIVAWNHLKVDLEIGGCIQQFISHGNLLVAIRRGCEGFFLGVGVFEMARW